MRHGDAAARVAASGNYPGKGAGGDGLGNRKEALLFSVFRGNFIAYLEEFYLNIRAVVPGFAASLYSSFTYFLFIKRLKFHACFRFYVKRIIKSKEIR